MKRKRSKQARMVRERREREGSRREKRQGWNQGRHENLIGSMQRELDFTCSTFIWLASTPPTVTRRSPTLKPASKP